MTLEEWQWRYVYRLRERGFNYVDAVENFLAGVTDYDLSSSPEEVADDEADAWAENGDE